MRLSFWTHALLRMFERRIGITKVRSVIEQGDVVEDYAADKPYPSRLMLGYSGKRPIHVVIVDDSDEQQTVVITAYEPDSVQWENDFKGRRQR